MTRLVKMDIYSGWTGHLPIIPGIGIHDRQDYAFVISFLDNNVSKRYMVAKLNQQNSVLRLDEHWQQTVAKLDDEDIQHLNNSEKPYTCP